MKIVKKYFIILLVLLIGSICKIYSQQYYADIPTSDKTSIFTETFDNNSKNWLLDNLWVNGKIADGYLDIICKNYQGSTGMSYQLIPIDNARDYEIETSFKTLKGTGGLAFGITSGYDHYRIEISQRNTLEIIKNTPSEGKYEKLFSGSVNSIATPGSYNKVTVRKVKDKFYIFLNESLIGSFTKINPEGDQVGFNVGLNSEINADYLNIFYISTQTGLTTAEKIPSTVTPQNDSKTSKSSPAPVISWVSPSGLTTTLSTYTARIRANVKSGSELKSVFFYVNGDSKGEGEIRSSPDETGTYITEKTITLNPGNNNVYLVATNNEGATKSELRYFNNPPANPPLISWGNPVYENVSVSNDQFTIETCIESPTELKSAKILVNGITQGENSIFQVSGIDKCNYKWNQSVILKEGDNSIYIIATNIAGSTTSEKRTIKYQVAVVEKRIALIFGNSEYKDKASLRNPVNDANLMEATLKDLGFDIIKRTNAGLNVMREAVREFSQKMSEYNVALFYYAGHGIQIDGINYLIPTDAVLKNPEDCKYEAIAVDFVTEEFGKYPDNTNIVILDACRNNPFQTWVRGGETGFKAITPTSGTIISFATAAGSTAIDGTGANGLFTEELVKQMAVPQPVESVFKKTRVEVRSKSKDLQVPMEWTNLNGDFYFKK